MVFNIAFLNPLIGSVLSSTIGGGRGDDGAAVNGVRVVVGGDFAGMLGSGDGTAVDGGAGVSEIMIP